MQILDRYLLRQFLQVFGICFCSLTGLYIVIDAFTNLEDFVAYAEKHGSLLSVMAEYYGYRSLSFFDRTSSTLALIAAMFTMAAFQRHNELTAIVAAGIPKSRVVKPIVLSVCVIALLAVINREVVIPSVREKFSRNAQDLLGDTARDLLQPCPDNKTGILLRGRKTVASRQQIHDPSFVLVPPLDVYGGRIQAKDAFYQEPADGRPGGYLMQGVQSPRELDQKASLAIGGEWVLITPHDVDWLKPDECFVVSDVTFEQLVGAATLLQYSSTPELISTLQNKSLDIGPDVRVSIHSRIVQPLLDITLLFLGLPLILSRENRNMFLAIGLCVGVVVAFMLIVIGCHGLGATYLISPALGAWAPLIIFVPLAAGLSQPLLE